jgi:hypothetical protein
MSIDATVEKVIVKEDGSGEVHLKDRLGGIAGQSILLFKEASEEVTALNGLNIWGGSNNVMLYAKETD